MAELLGTGRLVDLILLLMAAEGALLAALRHRLGLAVGALTANLLAGAFLLLALRTSLAGSHWGWTALCLLAALAAHLADLLARIRRTP